MSQFVLTLEKINAPGFNPEGADTLRAIVSGGCYSIRMRGHGAKMGVDLVNSAVVLVATFKDLPQLVRFADFCWFQKQAENLINSSTPIG